MMDKIRIRTQKELEEQGKLLALVRDVFRSNGIEPLVTGGTLLGIIREGDFIPWDWDAELFVKWDDVKNKQDIIVKDLLKKGLVTGATNATKELWKIEVGYTNHFFVEVRSWYRDGELFRRGGYNVPSKFFKDTIKVTLRNEEYTAPKDYDAYLSYVYGDWRTPKRTADKSEYLSKQHKPKLSLLKRMTKRLKKIILKGLNK